MKRSKRRDHLIDTAIELFCENGYHATGIDKIIKKAAVSKKTLYTHFRSKEELIIAALQRYDGLFRNEFMRNVESAGDTPRQKIEAIFDIAGQWFSSQDFYGCLFIKAVSEYSQVKSPFRDIANQFKGLIRDFFKKLCEQSGAKHPGRLANQLALILEGAIATSQVTKSAKAADTAKEIAMVLIAQELDDEEP